MKASLDTNVIIHLYRAGWKQILFRQFRDSVYVYDQIRRVELENHGQDVLKELDGDIALGKIQLITDEQLRNLGVLKLFFGHVKPTVAIPQKIMVYLSHTIKRSGRTKIWIEMSAWRRYPTENYMTAMIW